MSIFMRKHFFKITTMAIVAIFLTSCAGRKVYERPQVIDEKLFRTENISADSLSIANVSWKEIFTDPMLQKHISNALEHNLDLRVALQNINIAQAYFKQGKQNFFPTLALAPSHTYSTASLNTQAGALLGERTHLHQWDMIASTSWEADIWGKINAQKKAYYASFLATTAAHQAIQSEVVATLATSYYQLLMLDKQQRILEETIHLREESLSTTRELKQAGSTNEVAVQQTEALLYNAKAQLITIKNSIWALENTICILLGEAPHSVERSTLEEQTFPTQLKQGYAMRLLENRPDIRRAEYQLINAFELTNVARSAFYPSLTITARGGFSSTDLDNWFSPKSLLANVVGGLTQPIFNKRQIRSQYEISQANQEVALLNFKKLLLSAGKEVSDAMHNFEAQNDFISLKTKEMEAYQKATDYSKELFNSGLANYLEVITAEVNRLNAELNVANAQFAKMQYGIVLYKALGGGWR